MLTPRQWASHAANVRRVSQRVTDLTEKIKIILEPGYQQSKAAPYNENFHFVFDMGMQGISQQNQLVGDKSWRLTPEGNVKVDCTCTTDPKQMDPNRWNVQWTGTWDVASQRFVNTKIQKKP